MKAKKRVNWFKVALLLITIIEVAILSIADKNVIAESVLAWRLHIALIMCIPINFMIICAKRVVKNEKTKRNY